MEKRGGKREGAGRHKVEDKKKPVTVYIRNSVIEKNGKETLQGKLKSFADTL